MLGLRVGTVLVFALFTACGSSSEDGLYEGAGGKPSSEASVGGAAGSIATAGSAGTIASGGAGGVEPDAEPPLVDAAPDVPIPPPVDAGPDGNNPTACPPDLPPPGAPCNIFVNQTDCIYGFKHCVCSISTWLCVP